MSVPLPYLALVTDGIEIWVHYKRNGNALEGAGYWILREGEPLDCKGRRTAKDWRVAQRIAAEMGARNGESAVSALV